MNVQEAIGYLRTSILDDVSDIVTDWTTIDEDDLAANQFLWTNEELAGYIDEAQVMAARRSLLIQDVTTISVSSGVSEYSLDRDILKIKQINITDNGYPLTPIELKDLRGISNWADDTGTPEYYIKDWTSGYLKIYKSPTEDGTLTLYVYRLPSAVISWSAPTASFEIAEQYIIPMLDYAAYRAYNKQDADTYDPELSVKFLSTFNAEFQVTSAYSETRKSRSVHKTIRYGGV